ncbi:hypothetical protein HN371_16915 [Candidatus Poribacteria bacterium]|mgnify:CR=1 FL=1|nr:hypothetical protein [Candidatus Poribacteria bacterium]MBT5537285.1 hypothetical protein [Candidatus Poribacteria bacterium]MBT5712946.1 hypothetical protein [Candidatus Poribacteria bacterium]MBT7096553.1 hypothetical protein [Candidatus Poribacteria bacterium]MBT7808471.1 hypothetical protein [Candidatus Poribacteria bacterium]
MPWPYSASPDRRRVKPRAYRPPGPLVYAWLDGTTKRSHIYVKAPDEPDARLVYDQPGIVFEAKWSPDGEQIALNDDGLLVMNADGSDVRRLTDAEFWAEPPFTWGPGDREITYYKPKAASDGDLWVLDVADPANPRRLTREGGRFSFPSWSPDRSRIAYSWQVGVGGVQDVYVMDADGSITQITQKAWAREPSWSADGGRLVYVKSDGHDAGDLHIIDARAGAAPRRITNAPYNKATPVWLAYGRWIAYATSGDIHVVSIDGRETHKLRVREGVPAVADFDWFNPFRAVSASGRQPSPWGSRKAPATP